MTNNKKNKKNKKSNVSMKMVSVDKENNPKPITIKDIKNNTKNKNLKEKTITLVMIVKNEEKVITRCFDSVKDYIDYWVICDTGSTDNTKKIIIDYFKKENIPGELHEHKWKNFGHNRSLAVQTAKGKSDYSILLDADFIFVPKDTNFKQTLDADGYQIKYEGAIDYRQMLFVKASLDWKYVGVTHEYITCGKQAVFKNLDAFTIDHKCDGGSRSDKFTRDIQLLKDGIKEEPKNSRYMFYLAQSYKDVQDFDNAIIWYENRIKEGGWPEEVYYSMYQKGLCMKRRGDNFDDYKNELLKAYEYRPIRLEALYEIVKHCRLNNMAELGFNYGKSAINNSYPNDILFIIKPIHTWAFFDELALCAHNCNKSHISIQLYNRMMPQGVIPKGYAEQFIKNYELFKQSTLQMVQKQNLEMENISKVAIIIVNHNLHSKTDNLVEKLKSITKCNYDIIVVDNASNIQSKYTSVHLNKNIYKTNSLLIGLQYADSLEIINDEKYFAYCFVDTSCNLENINIDIINKLFLTLKENNDIVGISPSYTQDSDTAWDNMKNKNNIEKEYIYFVQNFFSMYKSHWFNKIGRFSKELKYGWGIDIETGYKAYNENKKIILDNSITIQIKNNNSYNDISQYEMSSNMISYFTNKYGSNYKELLYKNINTITRVNNNKFVIIIPSFNNEKWYKRNLDSVFSQKYDNYRVIYIDDQSEDNTYELVKTYISKNNIDNIQLFQQKKRGRQCLAKYVASHTCNDDEIIVILDGDDWLYHDNVLNVLNKTYNENDVWVTYGSFVEYENEVVKPTRYYMNKPHHKQTIENNNFRDNAQWLSSHLRTYKASVYKKIPVRYFVDHNGDFFKTSDDCAEMYSVLELSGYKQKCISDILYCYNIDNSNLYETSWMNSSKHKKMHEYRMKTLQQIKSMPKLKPLNELSFNNYDIDYNKINVVIKVFEKDIEKLIESLLNYSFNLYLDVSCENKDLYNKIKNKYNIKEYTNDDKYEYVIFIDKYIKNISKFNYYLRYLQQTKCSKFYLEPDLKNINFSNLTFQGNENNIVLFREDINDYSKIVFNSQYNKYNIYLAYI